jgi:hypothetical protein
MTYELTELRERISQLADDELTDMVTINASEYRQEALDFARKEIAARGLTLEDDDDDDEYQDVEESGEVYEDGVALEPKHFRSWVVLSQVCSLGIYIVQFATERSIPAEAKSYFGTGEDLLTALFGGQSIIDSSMELFSFDQWVFLVSIAMEITFVIAAIGLFRFRHWGPPLFVACLLLDVLLMAKTPFYLSTGLTAMVGYIGTLLEGMIVAIVYFTNFKKRFEPST